MTERWTDETLDRFASTVATAITATNEAIAANTQAIAPLLPTKTQPPLLGQ